MSHPLYRNFTTQAEIDAQYNAGASVPDFMACLRHYQAQAQRAREALPCLLDVPYGATLDESLDIFPAAQPNAPVWVFIHGGYWRALSSKDFSGVALGPHALGFTTVVVNYSLCPQVAIDEIVRQVRASVAWVVRNIAGHAGYGGDPARIVLGGHSAGAHLTAMALRTPWAERYGLPANPIAAALLVSGIYDLHPLRYSYLQPALQLDDGVIQRNSPGLNVQATPTPLLVSWGAQESAEFARQSSAFHDQWVASGGQSEILAQDGANHFSAIHGFENAASPLCRWMAQAVGQNFARG